MPSFRCIPTIYTLNLKYRVVVILHTLLVCTITCQFGLCLFWKSTSFQKSSYLQHKPQPTTSASAQLCTHPQRTIGNLKVARSCHGSWQLISLLASWTEVRGIVFLHWPPPGPQCHIQSPLIILSVAMASYYKHDLLSSFYSPHLVPLAEHRSWLCIDNPL